MRPEAGVCVAKVFPGQSAVFGRCIAQDFNGVYKGKCHSEFLKLKDCYTVLFILLTMTNSTADAPPKAAAKRK